MKSLFHFILLIICISTSNSSLYNQLRENVIQILKGSISDVAKRLPRLSNARSDLLLNKHGLRYGVEENLGEDFVPVDDDTTGSTSALNKKKRKRVKDPAHRNYAGTQAKANEVPNILRTAFIPNHNKEDKQQRDMKHSTPKLKQVKRKRKEIRQYRNEVNHPRNKINDALILRAAKNLYQNEDKEQGDLKDIEEAQRKAKILRNSKHFEDRLNAVESPYSTSIVGALDKQRYHMDPVLNLFRSRYRRKWPIVKSFKNPDDFSDVSSTSDSSADQYDWREEWKYYWAKKEFIATSSILPPRDTIHNQLTVRPLRASRSSERKKEKRRRKRQKARMKHKKQMKKNIDKIAQYLGTKIENQYKKSQYKKTSTLKKFLKHLKKQYKKDLISVKEIHEGQMIQTDAALQKKFNQIRGLNENFMTNATFRDIILNGKVTKKGARTLIDFYSELVSWRDKNVARVKSSEEDADNTSWSKFLQHLMKQYNNNITSIHEIHEELMKQTDKAILENLNQIKKFYEYFLNNDTFRDNILNGKVTKSNARVRIEVYPKLVPWRDKKTVQPESSEEKEDKTMLEFLQHLKKEYEKNITSVNGKDEPFKDRVYPEPVPSRLAKWHDKTVIRAKSSKDDYDVEYGYLYE